MMEIDDTYSCVTEAGMNVKIEWRKEVFYEYMLYIRNPSGSMLKYHYTIYGFRKIYCDGYLVSRCGLKELTNEINNVLDNEDVSNEMFDDIPFDRLIDEWLFDLHKYVSDRNIIENSLPMDVTEVQMCDKWSVYSDDVTIESNGEYVNINILGSRGSFRDTVDVEYTKKLLGNYVYILNYKPSYTKAAK